MRIADDAFDAGIRLMANINLYYHTNTGFDFPFNETENLFSRMDYDNDRATLRFNADAEIGTMIYLFYTQMLENADWADGIPFYSRRFNFDIALFTPDGFTFDINRPSKRV